MMKEKKQIKRKSNIGIWIILLISLLAALAAGGFVFWEMVIVPAQAENVVEEIRAVATGQESDREKTQSKPEQQQKSAVNFAALQKVNKDIIGWITIPNTVIDYPVLQASLGDPEYYLYRDYKGNSTQYGSIFADANAVVGKGEKGSQCVTLYGHHMNDGRMFADILKYGDLDFYKSAPVFTFDTYKEQGQWKVVSIFKANVDPSQGEPFAYVRTDFGSDEDFLNFVHQLMIRSIIDTGVTVNENDKLLVLSTCSYEFNNARTVVVARKIRKGESSKVNTQNVSYRSDPLYPDCWYDNGGKPSYPETFAKAEKQGLTSWYDGKIKS